MYLQLTAIESCCLSSEEEGLVAILPITVKAIPDHAQACVGPLLPHYLQEGLSSEEQLCSSK